jgi:hypothetical protein
MSDHLIITDLVRSLLECARQELVELDPTWEGRVCMNPYSVPTRDDCCKGQLQGTIGRYYPSTAFPIEDFVAQPCQAGYFVADVTISILDCLVGMGHHGEALPCDKLDDAHDQMVQQAQAVWKGVTCCLMATDVEWVFRSQTPLDNEQGGCMGTDLAITVGIPVGCPCG